MTAKRPPRLLVKTLAVIFIAVAVLLAGVFVVVILSVRDQVRQSVAASLESGQRIFAAVESRRQRELQAQAATLAENPTLKATVDTYAAEVRTSDDARRGLLLNTVANELDKVAGREGGGEAAGAGGALVEAVDVRANAVEDARVAGQVSADGAPNARFFGNRGGHCLVLDGPDYFEEFLRVEQRQPAHQAQHASPQGRAQLGRQHVGLRRSHVGQHAPL